MDDSFFETSFKESNFLWEIEPTVEEQDKPVLTQETPLRPKLTL